MLKDTRYLVLIGSAAPVAFFAYPSKPRMIMPPEASLITLATPGHDIDATLDALCHAIGAQNEQPAQVSAGSDFASLPTGKPTPDNVGMVIASTLPDHAIVVDESVTSGRQFPKSMPLALPHDVIDSYWWLDWLWSARCSRCIHRLP